MPDAIIRGLEWTYRYVAIYRFFGPDEPSRRRWQKLQVRASRTIQTDPDLNRLLATLQNDLLTRRMYRQARNPTNRVVLFRPPGPNAARECLDDLRRVENLRAVETAALRLVEPFSALPREDPEVLIFLISEGRFRAQEPENCVFLFKCGFQPISEVSATVSRLPEAIVETARKAAFYPYFDRDQNRFDREKVQVFDEEGESAEWFDFLDLGQTVLPELPPPRPPLAMLRVDDVDVTAPTDQRNLSWIVAEKDDKRYILIKGDNLEDRNELLNQLGITEFESLEEAKRWLQI